jgi:hypothetical protein
VAALVLIVAACGADSGPLAVDDAWSRATAGDTGVVYFSIRGGGEADALVGVTVPEAVAVGAALHQTVAAVATTMAGHEMGGTTMAGHEMGGTTMPGHEMGGGMTMQLVSSVPVEAGDVVTFEPGGYHVMLLGLVEPLVAGDRFEVTLRFEKAGDVVVRVEVRE